MKITLDEFCEQWCPKNNARIRRLQFEHGVEDFTTLAGNYTRRTFQASFFYQGFYKGASWQPKKSRWSQKFPHKILIDTSNLLRSIRHDPSKLRTNNKSRIYAKIEKYEISTNELSFPVKGKRGKSSGIGYAAVHNTDPKISGYFVNQHSKRRPIHRQFIGFNPRTDEYIRQNFVPIIFKHFPC